jgi:hypothetical protein
VTLRFAAPGILLASLLVLPFLDKPFTIDEPLYLRHAQHALTDPLHPSDFELIWNTGDRLQLKQLMIGSALPAYLLTPVAALGSREWIAHLYGWCFLCAFLLGTVLVSRRLGCTPSQCTIAGLLAAANPITLEMSTTIMPDLMAATFGVYGIERALAFRERATVVNGAATALLLAAASLCRASTVPLILVAALLLRPPSWKRAPAALWPVAIAFGIGAASAIAARSGLGTSIQALTGAGNIPRNLVSLLCLQATAGPLLLYWILARGRWALLTAATLLGAALLAAQLPSEQLRLHAVQTALALAFAIGAADLFRQVRAWPLAVWLFTALIVLPYVYVSAKYLLPAVPAAAIFIVLHAGHAPHRRYPLMVALLIATGWISGAAIIVGDNALARSQRDHARREIGRIRSQGGTVWAGGQWAFHEYALRAGALPLANQPPFPQPGDYILTSRLSYYGRLEQLPIRREYLYGLPDRRCGIFVLNRSLQAGFFSNRFGYLPFAPGCAELDRYDLWLVK